MAASAPNGGWSRSLAILARPCRACTTAERSRPRPAPGIRAPSGYGAGFRHVLSGRTAAGPPRPAHLTSMATARGRRRLPGRRSDLAQPTHAPPLESRPRTGRAARASLLRRLRPTRLSSRPMDGRALFRAWWRAWPLRAGDPGAGPSSRRLVRTQRGGSLHAPGRRRVPETAAVVTAAAISTSMPGRVAGRSPFIGSLNPPASPRYPQACPAPLRRRP